MEPVWLQKAAIVAVHRRVLAEHGGVDGIRDESLLESALARPQHLFAYGSPDTFALAASYAFGIAKNHPFLDGNKRAAFMAAFIFLARNGWTFGAPEPEVVLNMNRLAAGEMTEVDFGSWLKTSSRPAS